MDIDLSTYKRQADKQEGRQAGRRVDRQADRQAGKQTETLARQADRRQRTGGNNSLGEVLVVLGGEAVEAGEPADEGDHDGEVDEDELAHVLQHAAVRDLQLAERLAGGEDVGDASEAHHVGHREENPGQDLGVRDSVFLSRGDHIVENPLLIGRTNECTRRWRKTWGQATEYNDLDTMW